MKLKNSFLNNPNLLSAIQKISKLEMEVVDAIGLAKTILALEEQRKIVSQVYTQIISNKKEDEVNEQLDQLFNNEFEIPLTKKIRLTTGKMTLEEAFALIDIIELET